MRIGYVCKYVPVEALEAMGAHMERIDPDESLVSFDAAESCMHANVCSFAKATFETVLSGNLDGIVLTTCCDSMRRLADALRAQAPNLFIHVLDVPRDTGEAACALFERRVAELLSAYGEFANATFSEEKLFAQLGGTVCPEEGNCDSSLELRLRETSFRSCAAFIPPREVELRLAKFRQQQPGGGLGRMERRLRSF